MRPGAPSLGWLPLVVHRNEPIHARTAFEQFSTRYTVDVRTEAAPLPPQSTLVSGIGRDAMHARPTQWRYNSLSIPEIHSIIGHPFGVAKVPSALVVSMPRGRQNPLRPRTNIIQPDQTALGDMVAVDGLTSYSSKYNKIAF